MTDKEKIRKEVERLQKELIKNDEKGFGSDIDNACILELQNVLTYIDSLQEEPVSNDLEEAANDYAHDLVHDDVFETFIDGALWQKKHLWKDAQGDDLPEIDKEVIALIEAFGHYKVIFAHRVDENAEIHTSIDGKPLVLHPKKHGKGGWNISNIKWWLDIELPKMEE